MDAFRLVTFFFGVVAYSASSTLFFVDLARRGGSSPATRWASWVLGVAAALQAAHLFATFFGAPVSPFESMHFALSLSAVIATVVFLVLRSRSRIHALGAFVAPIGLTLFVGSQFATNARVTRLSGVVLAVHVTSNLLGMGLFILAGAASVLYLVTERRLKRKRLRPAATQLPPLAALDVTLHRLLLVGFPLLTLGVATGAIGTGQPLEGVAVARSLLGVASWILVAGVLVLRAVAGWRGRRAAYGTIFGVLCMMLVVLVYFVRPGAGGGL